MNARINEWIRPDVRGQAAYHVQDAEGLIKLDAMENPYGWPPEMVEAWSEALREASLNRYPDPGAARLKARLRDTFKIPAASAVLLGNGSDELIQMILMAVNGPGRVVVAPEPSFSMYRIISTNVGLDYRGVPLGADFSLDRDAALDLIAAQRPAVVFIAYPSNPSGNLFAAADIFSLIEAAPGLVVMDEAYSAFCDASFMEYLARYEHLLILRTVSKLGLAGLRLGFLVGAPSWLQEIDKLRLPYNIGVLAQASVEFALDHYGMLLEQAQRIRVDRQALFDALQTLPGVSAYPSQANFILFRVEPGRAVEIFERLKQLGVLIKNLHGSHPALADCLRVTVGTPEENRAFLSALRMAISIK
ncbi:MAG: histidinol-phosphate transaminase [Gammaproteobacteria bacterium]